MLADFRKDNPLAALRVGPLIGTNQVLDVQCQHTQAGKRVGEGTPWLAGSGQDWLQAPLQPLLHREVSAGMTTIEL